MNRNKINVISKYEAQKRGFYLIKYYYYTTQEEFKSEFKEPIIIERKMLNELVSGLTTEKPIDK